jgi:hypothetical protein
MSFGPLESVYENLGIHQDSNFQSESPFGSVWAHSLTFSHILKNVYVTPELHFQPTHFHALALVMNLRLRS